MTNKATWEQSRTDAISKMFENVDEHGIYPTTKFFEEIDKAHYESLLSQRKELMEAAETELSRLEVEVKPTHAEENGYGCALDDCRTLITSILSKDT